MDKKQRDQIATKQKVSELVRPNKPATTWEQLPSSHGAVAELRKISTDYKAGKRAIYLFAGASGTDKTMAAEVIANELGKDLLRIDLSAVASKYIGETEKNLDRVFAAAGQNGAVLLFDEADVLFGKRSEVKDSHDRYANIETSYLLQHIEAYAGMAILATNSKSNLDPAFLRRIRYVIDFSE